MSGPQQMLLAGGPVVLTALIPGSSSDCGDNGTTINLTAVQEDLGNPGTSRKLGFRFGSVTVPQGKTIFSAFIWFKSGGGTYSTTTVNLRFVGDAEDNAAVFSTHADFAARPLTSATVDWSSIGTWAANTLYSSPDLATIVQEIVNRGGWASGNALTIFANDNSSSVGAFRDCMMYDSSAGVAAYLVITYAP